MRKLVESGPERHPGANFIQQRGQVFKKWGPVLIPAQGDSCSALLQYLLWWRQFSNMFLPKNAYAFASALFSSCWSHLLNLHAPFEKFLTICVVYSRSRIKISIAHLSSDFSSMQTVRKWLKSWRYVPGSCGCISIPIPLISGTVWRPGGTASDRWGRCSVQPSAFAAQTQHHGPFRELSHLSELQHLWAVRYKQVRNVVLTPPPN